jgi:hypothetical protein
LLAINVVVGITKKKIESSFYSVVVNIFENTYIILGASYFVCNFKPLPIGGIGRHILTFLFNWRDNKGDILTTVTHTWEEKEKSNVPLNFKEWIIIIFKSHACYD